jgi:ribosome maturation factor RimP
MTDRAIDPQLLAELAAVAERNGCELVHAEWKGGVLRLFVDREDREGGVSLADCETVSRQVSALLDVSGFGTGRYLLEVSSPGLDRQLYGPRDYQRFVGRQVRVTFVAGDTGRKRTVRGRLAAYRPARGEFEEEVDVVDAETGVEYTIPLKNMSLARLLVET